MSITFWRRLRWDVEEIFTYYIYYIALGIFWGIDHVLFTSHIWGRVIIGESKLEFFWLNVTGREFDHWSDIYDPWTGRPILDIRDTYWFPFKQEL